MHVITLQSAYVAVIVATQIIIDTFVHIAII